MICYPRRQTMYTVNNKDNKTMSMGALLESFLLTFHVYQACFWQLQEGFRQESSWTRVSGNLEHDIVHYGKTLIFNMATDYNHFCK